MIVTDRINEYLLNYSATGNIFLRIFDFNENNQFTTTHRSELYSCILITDGKGENNSDTIFYPFKSIQLFFYTPYQLHSFKAEKQISGTTIQFHSDFFCLEKHAKEVACNGVLFNNIYGPPYVDIIPSELSGFQKILDDLRHELSESDVAKKDLLVSYLKIFLIKAIRIKLSQVEQKTTPGANESENLLNSFQLLIESNYKIVHSPGAYAQMLNISLKTLNNLIKKSYNKNLTQIIHDRLIIEAKRQLYLTEKPIKEISFELGFEDMHYFSRLFKKKTSISPKNYRSQLGLFR